MQVKFTLLLSALLISALSFDATVSADAGPFPLGPSLKEIVSITEDGVTPKTISLNQLDSSVFFVNRTKSSLLTVSVAFGKRRAHCASENIKIDSEGNLSSVRPIGPRDFAIMCFPDRGTYPVTITGVGPTGKTVRGEVLVE